MYCARSYAEEFNHLKLQLCRNENSQFHLNAVEFPNFMDPGPRVKYREKSLFFFVDTGTIRQCCACVREMFCRTMADIGDGDLEGQTENDALFQGKTTDDELNVQMVSEAKVEAAVDLIRKLSSEAGYDR